MQKSPKPATPAHQRPEEVASRFQKNYPTYQYHVVEFVTEHLADLSREFGGDLQQMLVLAIIGQVHLQRQVGVVDRAPPSGQDASISASRIADVTGIPRQTARRKLKALEARGWIERTPSATYRLIFTGDGSPAGRDLADIDRRSIERVARLFCSLSSLLARAEARA